ncbi:MAG: hypothetical protein J5806_00760 [Lentisphaeria bacterium]|nr:hypothetical protein [Lentisphaeria bacterium]
MARLRVFFDWISLIAAVIFVSLAMVFAVVSALVMATLAMGFSRDIPDSAVLTAGTVLLAAALSVCIFLTWKFGWRKTVAEEAVSRGQSLLQWETIALLLFLLLFAASFLTDRDWPALTGLSLPAVVLIPALIFPFRYPRNGFRTVVRCIGLAGAFSIFFWGVLILGRTGKPVSWQGDDPAGLPRSVQWIGQIFIPTGAVEIDLRGRSTACEWSCRVSEPDFRKFRARCKFEFLKIEKPRHFGDKGPFPYYFYEDRHRNGGGVTLRYDVANQRMTGSYSTH